jgi:hypothetical protein
VRGNSVDVVVDVVVDGDGDVDGVGSTLTLSTVDE